MKASDLTSSGFIGWFAFSREQEGVLLSQLPTKTGVYVVVFPALQSRKRDSSDVAYIGRAGNRDGVRHRIRQYFHPGWDNTTSLRMQEHMKQNPSLSIGYRTTRDKASAKKLESELLVSFEKEHGELPPFNKQRSLALLDD